MTCKLSPTISTYRVTLYGSSTSKVAVVVEADVKDINTDGKTINEIMNNYCNAVCVLSTDADFDIETVLANKTHVESPAWWELYTGDDIVVGQVLPVEGDNIVFKFKDIAKVEDVEYLSFFTYIQVKTEEIETDYAINIPLMFENMAGDYESGFVIEQCEITSQSPLGDDTDGEIIARGAPSVDTIRHFEVVDERTSTCLSDDNNDGNINPSAPDAQGNEDTRAQRDAKPTEERETPLGGQ